MGRFPVDAPKARVVRSFEDLGFEVVRVGGSYCHETRAGRRLRLAHDAQPPHHQGFHFAYILTQAGISREDFLRAYEQN